MRLMYIWADERRLYVRTDERRLYVYEDDKDSRRRIMLLRIHACLPYTVENKATCVHNLSDYQFVYGKSEKNKKVRNLSVLSGFSYNKCNQRIVI